MTISSSRAIFAEKSRPTSAGSWRSTATAASVTREDYPFAVNAPGRMPARARDRRKPSVPRHPRYRQRGSYGRHQEESSEAQERETGSWRGEGVCLFVVQQHTCNDHRCPGRHCMLGLVWKQRLQGLQEGDPICRSGCCTESSREG